MEFKKKQKVSLIYFIAQAVADEPALSAVAVAQQQLYHHKLPFRHSSSFLHQQSRALCPISHWHNVAALQMNAPY